MKDYVIGGYKLKKYLAATIFEIKGLRLKVGFFGTKSYKMTGKLVSEVALWNEFGVPSNGQPPRPFMRRAMYRKGWVKKFKTLYKSCNKDWTLIFKGLGNELKELIVESIWRLESPELAESTIIRKNDDKPLIETELMVHSVGYRVIKK